MVYQKPLFYELQQYPEGFSYNPEFITEAEEKRFLDEFNSINFKPYVYEGYDAKRLICSFTKKTGYPDFLKPAMKRAAARFGLKYSTFEHAMVTKYTPGTQLGWHRDMPPYDKIFGISLGSAAPFRFRREKDSGWERITVIAERRSLYCMSGPSRYVWQHSIPPVENLRYSITMRTANT